MVSFHSCCFDKEAVSVSSKRKRKKLDGERLHRIMRARTEQCLC